MKVKLLDYKHIYPLLGLCWTVKVSTAGQSKFIQHSFIWKNLLGLEITDTFFTCFKLRGALKKNTKVWTYVQTVGR